MARPVFASCAAPRPHQKRHVHARFQQSAAEIAADRAGADNKTRIRIYPLFVSAGRRGHQKLPVKPSRFIVLIEGRRAHPDHARSGRDFEGRTSSTRLARNSSPAAPGEPAQIVEADARMPPAGLNSPSTISRMSSGGVPAARGQTLKGICAPPPRRHGTAADRIAWRKQRSCPCRRARGGVENLPTAKSSKYRTVICFSASAGPQWRGCVCYP